MSIYTLAAAAAGAAPQNKFGFAEALEQGGFIAYATVVILGVMSFGSFFILFTKFFEQNKILGQYKSMRANFWKAPSLREGAAKLDKNSAWRQLVDDGIAAEDQHSKMTDSLEAHDWLHGSLARSEAAINSKLA
ncbi:MAG TPA: MotA/TolQ/ExbB proton channel family protein, partial [Novosphingobium sp.]|nr:MotA/TolQ/ExbB proton channel family protein [Novosphingobium sp.]